MKSQPKGARLNGKMKYSCHRGKRGEREMERWAGNKDLRNTEQDHGWDTVNRNFEREESREK